MKKIIYLIAIFCSLNMNNLMSQDVVFSNPMLSPTNLNPALTGVHNSKIRLQSIYRNQNTFLGKEAFNTFSVAIDQRGTVGKYDFFGIGISILGDKAGAVDFKTINAKLSGSYIKRIGGKHATPSYLVGGIELGATQKSFDLTNAQWGSQHDGNGQFNPEIFAGTFSEDLSAINYFDLGAGILFFINDDENAKNLYIGAAYHHLNPINQSFSTENEILSKRRITIHAGGEFPIDGHPKNVRLLPKVVFQSHSPAMQVLFGIDVKFELVKNNSDRIYLRLGGALRLVGTQNNSITSDALVLNTRLDYNQLTLGLSYDITLSNLNKANNGAGAFELAVMYHFGDNSRNPFCPGF